MYTLVLLLSMTYSSQGGMQTVQVPNLSYDTCQHMVVEWGLGSEVTTGNRKGYTVEHSSCIPQAEVVK